MKAKDFILGFMCCALLFGCASFAYTTYGLDGVNYSNGKLLAAKPEGDKAFMECAPTAAIKHPCVVLFATEWFRLKQDFIDTQNKLKTCEAGSGRTGD